MFKSITVVGNIGNDPEIRHLPSGSRVASFSVASNEKWTDRTTGEIQSRTEWFRVVCYQNGESGLVTNLIQKWLRKGQLVFVQGDPSQRKYIDSQGLERFAFEIKLGPQSVIKMLGGRPEGQSSRTSGESAGAPGENGHDPLPAPNTEAGDPGPEVPF